MGYSPWDHKESDMTEQLTHTHTHKSSTMMYFDTHAYALYFKFKNKTEKSKDFDMVSTGVNPDASRTLNIEC